MKTSIAIILAVASMAITSFTGVARYRARQDNPRAAKFAPNTDPAIYKDNRGACWLLDPMRPENVKVVACP